MNPLRFGIVGCGMIADVIVPLLAQVAETAVVAVAGRGAEEAGAFADRHRVPVALGDWRDLVQRADVDAVYVATPTGVREEIAVAAAHAGKHVLAEKPFASLESLQRIQQATAVNGVLFMDATHFVHNPRTHQIKATMDETIGPVQALRCSFFVPSEDRGNIRFDPHQEPMGVVGDLAWYCLRCVTEYLRPQVPLITLAGHVVRDVATGAAARGAGLLVFADGRSATFDVGYDCGTLLTDLDLIGTRGMLQLDDYVMDRKFGFTTTHPEVVVGYHWRQGMRSRSTGHRFVETDSTEAQTVRMIRDFVALTANPTCQAARDGARATQQTQALLDAFWLHVTQRQP